MDSLYKTSKIRHLFLWVAITLTVGIIMLLFPFDQSPPSEINTLIMLIFCLYIVPVWWFMKKLNQNNHPIYGLFRKPASIRMRTIVASTIMPIIFGVGMILLVKVLLLSVFPESVTETEVLPSIGEQFTLTFAFNLAATVFIAPICEEIIFRGYLLGRLSYKFGLKRGIIISSFIFGLLHLQNVFGATMIGIVFCLLFIKTNSLVIPIIVHIASNTIVAMRDIYFAIEAGNQNVQPITSFSFSVILIGALILTAIGLTWLVPFLKENWWWAIKKGYPILR